MAGKPMVKEEALQSSSITTSHSVNYNNNHLYKRGNFCELTVNLTMTSAVDAYGNVGTIPEGYRPKNISYFVGETTNGTYTTASVFPDGRLTTSKAIASGGFLSFSGTYYSE